MIRKHFCTIAASLALLAACGPAWAVTSGQRADDAFLGAKAAFRAGDPNRLARYAAMLEGYSLQSYVDFWQLQLRLEEMPSTEVRAYLAKYPGSYLADRLRSGWLKELGKRREWQTFDLDLAPLVVDDADIRCYALASRLARRDDSALSESSQYWLEPRELPEGCATVVNESIARGQLTVKQVWQRIRVLLEAGQMTAARRTMAYLPATERPDEKMLTVAATKQRHLRERHERR